MAILMEHPFAEEKVRALKVGDLVCLRGLVITGRDRVHRFLAEGGDCPVSLADGALFHCGPVAVRGADGWEVKAAGPTTSMRQEPYMERVIRRHRVRVIIGKGGMGESTRKACVECGCVYLQAVGGAASRIAETVREVGRVHFAREFGLAEAMWEFTVDGLEAVVTMDTAGRNLHGEIAEASGSVCRQLIETGQKSRAS